MKPVFALSLSLDGISLLHRVGGVWSVIGDVALDDPDLRASLARLRESALALSPSGAHCKIAIPNEQIRYLTIETGSFRGETRREMARAALDGATPYAVSDLVFDYAADGNLTHIAAVARETLEEAEAFAIEHAFEPVSFVSIPDSGAFPDEPHFGQTALATQTLGEFAVEPDATPITIVGNTPAIDPSAPVPDETHDPDVLDDLERDSDTQDAPAASAGGEHAADPDDDEPHQDEPHGAGVLVADPVLPDELLDPASADADVQNDLPAMDGGTGVPDFASRRPHGEGDEAADPANQTAAEPEFDPEPVAEFVHRPLPEDDGGPEPSTKAADASETETTDLEPSGGFNATGTRPGVSDEPVIEPDPDPEPETEEPPEPEPSIAERVAVSVAAPTLDIPDSAPSASKAPAKAETRIARFLSRRKRKSTPVKRLKRVAPPLGKRAAPESRAIPIAPPIPAPMSPVLAPEDEAQRMTVFGARRAEGVDDGKPRHLGLILTAALLLFLAVVAAWSTMFSDDQVADGDLTGPSDPVEQAVVPEQPLVTVPEGQFAAPDQPGLTSPDTETALSVPSDTQDAPDQVAPESPELTDTDVAVLDALRDETEPTPQEAPADQTATPDELETEPEAVEDNGSPGQAEARYAATGIWQDAPQQLAAPDISGTDDLYIASIDSTDIAQDAVALPDSEGLATDLDLPTVGAPAEPGSVFALDAQGLVTPTPEGTLNPDGILVYAGRPDVVPPPAPLRFRETPDEDAALALLAGKRPRLRPDNLIAESERRRLGGRTLSELQGVRPRLRPANAKLEAERDETPTEQAVVVSRKPLGRPAGFAELVAEARANAPAQEPENPEQPAAARQASTATATTVAPATVTPRIPSSASVARQATLDNAINLRRVNLIGVYGTPSNRRALVRLPSGRYKKVKVGDRVDGGRIIAISDSELRYQKGGRNLTLKMPRG